jgi:tetratricopeptide (TPR) repeat protein
MKRFLLITASIALLTSNLSFSQARIENRNKFYEAEGYLLFEEYEEALTLYLELIKSYPNNNNLKYRIGQCYINIPNEKEKSLSYLEEAVKNINPKYKEGRFRENRAPYDVYYYLANAYRINNQIDKALETYEIFNKNLNTKIYNPDVVKMQIQSCLNARELMKTPLYLRKQNLGDRINNQYPDLNPVVSGDQNSMVYNRLSPFQEDLFYVRKQNGVWSDPVNIIPDLGLGQETGNYATSLSNDGKELFIYRRGNDYDGNIYVTKKLSNDKWTNIVKLNDNINTKYWESHATVSHDGKKLYFTSNRKDTYGGLDIYVSVRDTGNSWGPAVNLGPVINSVYNEDTPFLSEDDKTLFFSSAGHYNMGGYDIFYSTLLDDGKWSVPLNVGYPLNTTDDDLFFHPLNDGYEAYYSMIGEGGYGLSDIYRIEIFSENHPRKFIVKGSAKVDGLLASAGDSIKIRSSNNKNPEKSITLYSDPFTGKYEFPADQGDYILEFEAPGAEKITKELNLSLTSPSDTIIVPGVTLPKTDLVASLKVEEGKVTGNDIAFRIKSEPGAVLTVEKWAGDSLISSELININDTILDYKTNKTGNFDKLTFKVTDRYGNATAFDVPVETKKPRKVIRTDYTRYVASKEPSKPEVKQVAPVVDTARKQTVVPPVLPPVTQTGSGRTCGLWYLWVIVGAGIILFVIILLRKRKKDKKQ